MALHNDLGKKGEQIAGAFLLDKGYTILARNWVFGKAEIDIIARQDQQLVFLEVKTRSSHFFGYPELFVTPEKERHLEEASAAYMEEIRHEGEIRFDIIAVTFSKQETYEVHHIEDAFFPGL
jgi:putative endonuclease